MIRIQGINAYVSSTNDGLAEKIIKALNITDDNLDGITIETWVTLEITSATEFNIVFPVRTTVELTWQVMVDTTDEYENDVKDEKMEISLKKFLSKTGISRQKFAQFLIKNSVSSEDQTMAELAEHFFIYRRFA